MNETARFLFLACALVAASVFWLVRRSRPQGAVSAVGSASLRTATSLGLAVGIPVSVVALYACFGDLAGLTPPPPDPVRAMAEERTDRLALQLETRPDDVEGLRLLARSCEQLGRLQQAVRTRERLVTLRPDDPDGLVDLADTLSMSQGGSYVGEPIVTVRRALAIDPLNARALAAVANEAAERNDLPTAITSWERIASAVPADSEVGRSLRANIASARAELAARTTGSTGNPR